MDLEKARAAFCATKANDHRDAMMRVATLCQAGMDLDALRAATPDARVRFARRLRRLVERERLRGMARTTGYDLNRHIALGNALREMMLPETVGRHRR